MKMVELKCHNCGKKIHVLEEYVREKMFCTIGCLDSFNKSRIAENCI